MSKIALSGNPSGTGTFTLASPNSNTDRTLTLPDVSGTLVTTNDIPSPTIASTAEAEAGTNNTNFITPLRMREGFNATGSAPVYACRAWVNFDGTTSPGTIRASGNVSSVTRVATGEYTINFATALPDANYSAVGSMPANPGIAFASFNMFFSQSTSAVIAPTTSGFRIQCAGVAGGVFNPPYVTVSVFR
jgi:hypothetical protein